MALTKQDTKNLAGAVVKALEPKFKQIDRRFEQVDRRFEQVDKRFEQVDKRFEQVDRRFEQVDKRFEQVDERFGKVDGQFKGMSLEIGTMFKQVPTKREFDELKERLEERFENLEVRHEQLAGDLAVFESKVTTAFTHVEERFQDQEKMIKQGFEQIGILSAQGRMHSEQIAKIHQVLGKQTGLIQLAIDRIGNVNNKVTDHEARLSKLEKAA